MKVKVSNQIIDNVISIEEFCEAHPVYKRLENEIWKWELDRVIRGDKELTITTPDCKYHFTNKDYEIVED